MGARRIDGQAVNGERRRLAEVIPLDTPYAIAMFSIYACNFKCSYCIHSIDVKQRPHVVDKVVMDIGLYKKIGVRRRAKRFEILIPSRFQTMTDLTLARLQEIWQTCLRLMTTMPLQ